MTPGIVDTALLDWGIGGLGVYRELRRRDPSRRILYISDAGATPYGVMTAAALASRVLAIAEWLSARDIRRLAIACNAASTVLPRIAPHLARLGIESTGVIEHGIGLAIGSGLRRIAVIGGGRTIRSGAYVRALRGAGIDARGRVAQPLSARVEEGDLTSDATRLIIDRVLSPVRTFDGLLLACTHYPALREQFASAMPHATLLDPAEATADAITTSWRPRAARTEEDLFVTTGDLEQMRRSAMLAFGVNVRAEVFTHSSHRRTT